MLNLLKISKYEFGEILTPEKIYNFKYKDELKKIYEKVYFDNVNYLIIANLFFLSVIFSLIIYILIFPQLYIYLNEYFTAGPVYKFLTIFITYSLLEILIYWIMLFAFFFSILTHFKKIEKQIEIDLPEFLDNLVSNLKGGVSLEKALLRSVRENQKILLKEITYLNEKILMGQSALQAIAGFRERFSDSPVISRTFFLIEEGIKSGGNLAEPLEKISDNLKNIYMLNNEIKASLGGFSVVIMAISLVISPLLFALAITLLNFIGNLFMLLSKSNAQIISVSGIPPEFTTYLIYFSYAMIALIVTFSSLITSQLKGEKTYEALKYLPIFLTIGFFLYWLLSKLLLSFFSNIF
jgi:pilus assembly protein TadC